MDPAIFSEKSETELWTNSDSPGATSHYQKTNWIQNSDANTVCHSPDSTSASQKAYHPAGSAQHSPLH
jgi:hypothetical protein